MLWSSSTDKSWESVIALIFGTVRVVNLDVLNFEVGSCYPGR